MADEDDLETMEDKIIDAYLKSNIIYDIPVGLTSKQDIKYEWLSAMGMLETLIIIGIHAKKWEKWDEYNGR